MVFVMQDGLVGADADVKVAILRSLSKEFNVTTVQEVVTTGNEYFFCHLSALIGLFKKSS